jgi:tRNA pseudouridine55 synthase
MERMVTKQTNDFSSLDFLAGETLLIDKPPHWTSFKVVHSIRKAINVKRVGHTGTLDPMATGLLIILTGKSTKQMMNFEGLDKTYSGVFILGKTSPSMDTETNIEERDLPVNLSEKLILKTREKFVGEILQMPPMYSALKVDGRKLYDLARKGKTIDREKRKVNIYRFEISKIDLPEIHFEIRCSKGTYIRVIANDFGEELGCGALLASLRRTKIGEYDVEDALNIDDFMTKIEAISDIGIR